MTTSENQLKANQQNAEKSTGPKTEEGKQVVANNALKHGLFSKQLILNNESETDYLLLLEGLETELNPVGMLEQSLVERIAVTLWRQRRLVRSETAQINLNNKVSNIVSGVNKELNLNVFDRKLNESDLTEFDSEQLLWCQAVVREYEQMNMEQCNNLSTLKKQAPYIYKQLSDDADMEQQSIEIYIENYESLKLYVDDLIGYCSKQIQAAEQRPLVLEIARSVQSKSSILHGKVRESLAKYQVMLDNELYKAIKALRETQTWRLSTLESVSEENGFVLENEG